MAKVTHVRKAQKSKTVRRCFRGGCGHVIDAGESYKYVSFRIGRMSTTRFFCAAHDPKRSELTMSDKLSQLYCAQEGFQDEACKATCVEDVAAAVRSVAEVARDVAQEYRDSMENMPEGLRESSGIEEKAEQCDNWEQELESAADEIDAMEAEEPEGEETEEDKLNAIIEEATEKGNEAVDNLEL